MKKLFLTLTLLVATIGAFANEKAEKKSEKNVNSNVVATCCTATLTFRGKVVDSQTVCSEFPTANNCAAAKSALLDRNPDAKKSLGLN